MNSKSLTCRFIISDREQKPLFTGSCTWYPHRGLNSMAVKLRFSLGAEVNLGRRPKSLPWHCLRVQERLHSWLLLSSCCHLYAGSLLKVWASCKVLPIQLFPRMPYVKWSSPYFLECPRLAKRLATLCMHLGMVTKEKAYQCYKHFPQREQSFSLRRAGCMTVVGMKDHRMV